MTAVAEALAVFERERPHLLGLAYRMLGVVADAEDVVQDAWLRWQAADRSGIDRPGAWLTTVATRLALDRLRAQRRRREQYVGPWLPEPVLLEPGPEEMAELSESLTIGFLSLLDNLQPVERAVYLLVEVFGRPYAEVGESIGKSEVACRQIVSRARRRLRQDHDEAAPHDDRAAEADRLVHALLAAITQGDVAGALASVAPDVVLVSDGGPHRRAARRPVVGPDRVVRLLINLYRREGYGEAEFSMPRINGCPGLVVSFDGVVDLVLVFEVHAGAGVSKIWVMRNPDKLTALQSPFPVH
ncbi:MAG TPA: RNA polymerase sigma factor SigJ [Acidimicrobiales bacterium]|nr:RNA polymerase sigma factor SigJ [Acidimicrobiales bacterium]